jgi:P27 family predicted phage terminase small subunit
MKGRKPKPTVLKLLQGNPGRRAINESEPKYHALTPEIPVELQDEKMAFARAEWERQVPQLIEAGIARRIDRTALAMYCVEYQHWAQATEEVRALGTLIRTKDGWIKSNPYLAVQARAFDNMLRLMAEFGLTPSSRVRLKADIPAASVDPLDEYLNFRGKN